MPPKRPLFDRCLEVVLKNEGGFQDNPNDPGNYLNGKLIGTNFGITPKLLHKYFREWDIRTLTKGQVREVYRSVYWNEMRLEGIENEELVLQIFDFGVNAGFPPDSCRRSIRMIQGIVNAKPIDGICGPITKKAINEFKPIIKIESGKEIEYSALDLFKSGRIAYYRDLANRKPELSEFLRGWLIRVEKTKL